MYSHEIKLAAGQNVQQAGLSLNSRIASVCGVLMLVLAACGSGSDQDAGYVVREPENEGGSGRFYMDREIADLIESEHGALWLDRPGRDVEELPNRLIKILDLNPSAVVADIGAGTGYFTFRIADKVPHGRVYAVDVQPALLDTVRARAAREGRRNIWAVEGSVTDPNLPDGRVDVALIVSSYHEFTHPREMMAEIYESLRPGGRLVVVEYRGEDPTIPVPEAHRMTEEQIRRELVAAGFEYLSARDVLPQQHLLIFQKPVE